MEKRSLFSRILQKRIIIMIFLFILQIIVFAILSTPNNSIAEIFSGNSRFLNPKNLVQVINQLPIAMFLTTGITLLMISGKLDLSTGANGTLCAMVVAALLRDGMPLVPTLLIAIFLGVFVGFVNAVLVNELRVAPFVATIATTYIAQGVTHVIADKLAILIDNPYIRFYGTETLGGVMPVTALVSIVFMIITGIVLHQTRLGRRIYLVGGNPQAAMLSGVNPKKTSYVLFMVCGLFSAFAGITYAARQMSGNMSGISAARYQGITAAVLGGIAFGGGSGGMAGAFVGLLVLNTFTNGLTTIGTSVYFNQIATGLLLIFALTLDFIQQKQAEKVVA